MQESKKSRHPKSWWSEGIRFQCQGSGKCCVSRGDYGYVYLTLKDRQRLAKQLKISTRDFTQKYCGKDGDHFFIQDLPGDGNCRFLQNGNRCGVYEGRPAQCRTWPFWPENMNARTWSKDVAAFCPGVGKGKLYTADDIKELLAQDPLK